MGKMKENVKKAIDEIRPYLQLEGGDVQLVDVDEKNKIVKVKMTGACAACPMAEMTLKQGIEADIKKKVPEVKEVQSA